MNPTQIVLKAVDAIFTRFDADCAAPLLATDYVQHNPAVPTGAAPILGFIPLLRESGIALTIHRVISEGPLVVLHSTYRNAQLFGGETLVGFDVFRVNEAGQLAEHWDNLQPLQSQTASGNSMTDGVSEISDRALTAANRTLVEGFVHDVLHGHAAERVSDYIDGPNYVQHNPLVENGLDGLGRALEAFAAAGQAMRYTRTPLLIAEGDFVFAASEGALGDTPTAFFDLFRVAHRKIVEHWDVVAPIPAEMAHSNGKF